MTISNFKLRDYQQDILNKTIKAINDGKRGILIQLPCRSGKSYIMAKMIELAKGEVLVLAHRKELLKQHQELINSLGLSKKCRISSVFTEVKHLKEHEKPAVILIDECHLSNANSYIKTIEHYNSIVIGFSATPTTLKGEKLVLYDCLIQGVSTQELINRGNIANFNYLAPNIGFDDENISVARGDYVTSELADVLSKSVIYGKVIENYNKYAKGKQAIAYCVNVEHSKQICELFNSNGIKAKHIDGGMNKANRKTIMEDFKNGKITVLCNCNIISEGITLPSCDVCLLLRPTQSLALYIQQAMRCLTPLENKKALIIDFVGNFQRHGLPNEEFEWTLEGSNKKHKEFNENGILNIRACNNCFKVFLSHLKACPYCNTSLTLNSREIKNIEEIKLKEITEQEVREIAEKKRALRQEVGKARTKEELIRIAKQRGYKIGWVFQQMKLKNIR